MPSVLSSRTFRPRFVGLIALLGLAAPAFGEMPKVPDGFKIRLVAAVPAVSYPSQVATAPDGSLFVGEDPMDQVGPADKPIDRILVFKPGAAEPVVFAEGFNAIFGMLWHQGSLYVMNMPNLTVLRDKDGDGKADERTELFTDMGVPAGFPNMLNDHIVSGIQVGMDGWLYISVGDKGVPKATGPDGRTIQLKGGGIVRCRPDGRELEVYSSGTRNHLEPNLSARDDLFTYDNTDDGLGWWTRVVHHVDGGYFGYPFDYHDRTDKLLPFMADYGGGSPCGGVVYEEDAWPEEYRGRAFWSEWGKRSVRAFRFKPKGASFEIADVVDFVQPGDVENFRPLDLALSHDGETMYVADWSMGGWGEKKENLGRIYAVTCVGPPVARKPRGADSDPTPALIASLDHPARAERLRAQRELISRGEAALADATKALADAATPELARRHLVWTVAGIASRSPQGAAPLTATLKDPSADVRAQAARAIGRPALRSHLALQHPADGDEDTCADEADDEIGDPALEPEMERRQYRVQDHRAHNAEDDVHQEPHIALHELFRGPSRDTADDDRGYPPYTVYVHFLSPSTTVIRAQRCKYSSSRAGRQTWITRP